MTNPIMSAEGLYDYAMGFRHGLFVGAALAAAVGFGVFIGVFIWLA